MKQHWFGKIKYSKAFQLKLNIEPKFKKIWHYILMQKWTEIHIRQWHLYIKNIKQINQVTNMAQEHFFK